MQFKKSLIILLAFVLIMGMFTGCGKAAAEPANTESSPAVSEGSEVTPSAEPATEEVSQGVTDTEILIGNSAATSGAFAPIGLPFIHGIEAYLEAVNSAGGIDGRKIKFIHYDDEFDPATTAQYLEKLLFEDKVFSVVGHFGSPCIAATLMDLEDSGVPAVYFAGGVADLYSTDDPERTIYPVQPIYSYEGKIMSAYAINYFKATKVAIIYTNNEAGINTFEGIKEQLATYPDITIVAVESVSPGLTDATAQVLKVKEAAPEVIIIPSLSAELAPVLKTMEQQGVTGIPVVTTYSNVSSVFVDSNYNEASKVMENLYGLGWVDLESNPKVWEDFVANMTKLGYQDELNAYSATGWIAGSFFTEGVRRVADNGQVLNFKNYMEALESAPIQNPFGGSISYADGMRTGTQQMVLSKVDVNSPSKWTSVTGFFGIDDLK
ncbi:ABC transporter substrate-binding protein [Fusibacter sp. 3D3]|uniref:ABC transporter substrate-binding protein n=1 Tax=Fusibacter sp. 3D3 TaxID=1048380 RepID=UPI00085332AF|nr:ABC transporter substrate-binding protein [Fusibacter sp. 3D3]GAU78172.1 branched-chain amino acid ABC transporter, amino acid-binding protein [Fusibacter sp. 3D3]